MKIKFLLGLSAFFFCRSLLAGENDVPSRASTLPQDKPPAARPAAPDACCKEKAAADKPSGCACCREIAAAPFSKESLYQIDGKFTDDSGHVFALGDLRGQPVALDMFFASCGYACPLTVTDLLSLQGRLPAEVRGKVRFVLVSFDTARDTPAALAQYRAQRGLDDRWILLHGDAGTVRELAALLGVKYKQDADGAFSHSNIITILNPEGEIAHQRVGLQGGLDDAARALVAVAK